MPLFLIISLATNDLAIGNTSIGNGNLPNTSTTFDSSTMHTKNFEALAIIFSLVNAPPPPLINCKFALTSSAPSIYIGISLTSFKSNTRIPFASNFFCVEIELATAPDILFFKGFKYSMK